MASAYSAFIHSDGSGCDQGFSGYCASVTIPKVNFKVRVMGAMSNMTVPRAELMGIIEALRYLFGSEHFYDGIKVHIACDNKAVCESASYRSRRIQNRELWLVYDCLAEKMDLTIEHIDRNTEGEHQECDVHASTMRQVLKAYIEGIGG